MIPLFQPFATLLDAGVGAGVVKVLASSLAAVAPELTFALTIFVIIQGILIAFRRYDFYRGMSNMLRAVCVVLLLAGSYFATWVQRPFLTTIPNWIAGAINGATGPNAGAQQFDLLLSAIEHLAAAILQQSDGWTGIGNRIEVIVIMIVVITAVGISFVIWELGGFLTALTVCLGPFVLIGLLFAATRPIAERWIGQLIGFALLQLLDAILLQFIISAITQYVVQAQNAPGSVVDEQIMSLLCIAAFAGMCAVMAILVPAIAAYIGGGVSMNVAGIVKAPARALPAMRR